jgi:signal transduction histidine kinase
VRPVVLGSTSAAVLGTWFLQPGLLDPADVLVVFAGTVAMLVAWALSFVLDPSRIALAVQGVDVTLILLVMVYGSSPEQAAQFLLMPIIGLAYFGSVRATVVGTIVTAIAVEVASLTLDNWVDDKVVSPIAFLIVICGLLVAFITSRARRAEHLLELDVARDRVALRLARSIRMADDPSEAIRQIARTIGSATGAEQAVVVLLEHDDDYVADIAGWQRAAGARAAELDVASIDATVRHLVSTGHGALLDASGTRLLTPVDSDEVLAPGHTAIEASVRALLHRIGGETGVVAALPMGGRAVGAIVLAAGADHDWETEAVPLLDTIAPQLAAGLAQVVLVRDQRDALESLERLDRMRDRLIANVSHELRTPLTSTIGFIETLLRDDLPLDDSSRHLMMEHARDGGLRLLALVEDLLALGSTRPESLDLVPEPMYVSHLVVDAIRGIQPPADRHIALQVDDDPLVTVDRNRMLQVFGNLVVNAVHHGEGDVEVRCHSRESAALIDVIDDGPGVAPEHVHELFLPFARFSTRSDSTGLGLAICRTIVEAHGGSIDYDRVPGGRTRFRVRMPASRLVVGSEAESG